MKEQRPRKVELCFKNKTNSLAVYRTWTKIVSEGSKWNWPERFSLYKQKLPDV